MHPGIVNLDVGDCHLHDEGVSLLCGLLQTDGAKPGRPKVYGRSGGVGGEESDGISRNASWDRQS